MAKYQGSKLGDGTPLNVAVYKAYRNAGLSHTQALAVTAEVGRENGFNAGTLFGFHTDPAANDRGGSIQNIGMLSWNRNRGNALAAHLKKSGAMSNGRMAQTQANLNAQAQFSVREMKSPTYAKKLRSFWGNPNASPETYAKELGKHYIAWAYGQDTIKAQGGGRKPFDWRAHDVRRRGYLNTLSGMLGGGSYQAEPTQQAPQPLGTDWNAFKSSIDGQSAPKPLGTNWSDFKSKIDGSAAPEIKPLGTDWNAFKATVEPVAQPEPLGTNWEQFKNTVEPTPAIEPLGTDWDSFKQQLEGQSQSVTEPEHPSQLSAAATPQPPILNIDEQRQIIGEPYGSHT